MTAPKRLRIGILSHAHGHVGVYCREMREFDDVELVASWDADEERGQRAAEAYGLQHRKYPEEVFDDAGIDAVFVGSETNNHADLIVAAAAAGKDIVCQKPLATTLADCDRIAAAVNEHGVRFTVAYQMRHDPVNQKIKELLDDGAIGKVAMARRRHAINVLLNPGFTEGPTRWHVDPVANVGMFFDDASHAADWFLWMLGMPVSVVAEIDRIVTDVSPDDNGVALYRFARGEMGVLLNSSTTVAAVSTTEIYGDEGTIVHDYGDSPSTGAPRAADAVSLRLIRRGDQSWTEFPIPIPARHGERIAAVARPVVDYLRGATESPPVAAEEGRQSVEMVLAAYRSASEGRRVPFPLEAHEDAV